MRISATAKLLIAIALLTGGSAIAEPLNRLSAFHSCDEFIAALKALKPPQEQNIYSRALSIEDFGEGHSDTLIVPEAVEAVTEVWRSAELALVFATARPKTEASNSVVGIIIILSYFNDAWRFTSLRRYDAIGKYSEITCTLTSDTWKGYTPGQGVLPAVITLTRHSGGRGAAQSTSWSLLFQDSQLYDYK
jgi:hypothetical protein